jgi:hypothetical protein
MAMTKKDYELIAQTIAMLSKDCVLQREKTLIGRLATALANRMYGHNPSFEVSRFLAACKLPKIEGWNC